MKLGLTVGAMCLILAGSAWTQVRAQRRTFGSRSGFGNVLFPGTGGPPPIRANRSTSGIQIRTPHRGVRTAAPVAYPVAVPAYYGGYGYAPPARPVQPPPQVTVVTPPQPASPPVIINNYYNQEPAKPVAHQHTAGEESQNGSGAKSSFRAPAPLQPSRVVEDAKPTIYLIAYKDHSIYPALGYWVEDDTLHYITTQGSHNRASVELIDKAFSEQLNLERGLDFELAIGE